MWKDEVRGRIDVATLRRTGKEIADFLQESYHDHLGVHAETVVGAAAALTGEYSLRAVLPNLPRVGWIAGGPADELILGKEGEIALSLWKLILMSVDTSKSEQFRAPDIRGVTLAIADSIGRTPFPPLSAPAIHFPREWSPEACPRFRKQIDGIGAQHKLSQVQLAMSLAIAVALLIERAKGAVPIQVLLSLTAEIMIGVSRMAPLPDNYQRSTAH